MEGELVTQIRQEISTTPVVVYSKTWCGFCSRAKSALSDLKVEFKAIELDLVGNGQQIQNTLEDITRQRTVPNIFIGGEHVGGCSELMQGLKNGKVRELFQKNSIQFS